MLSRPTFPKEKTVLIVTDFPIKMEIDQDIIYSSASNLKLVGELHKVGVAPTDYGVTYLSFQRPESDNFDWYQSFAKFADLEPYPAIKDEDGSIHKQYGRLGEPYIKLAHQKDCWVAKSLYDEFEALLTQIAQVKPKIIIVAGKWALFFLSGILQRAKMQGSSKDLKALAGLIKYRASIIPLWEGFGLPKCILFPILPPTTAYRMPDKAPIMTWDYRKLGIIYKRLIGGESLDSFITPNYTFLYNATFATYIEALEDIYKQVKEKPTLVSVDKETRGYVTDCIGLSTKIGTAVCIPFATIDDPLLWSLDEEVALTSLITSILKHKNCLIVGQSFAYDAQYIYRHWLLKVNAHIDTMILHHVIYNYMKKSLDVLASIYCDDYVYWKDMQEHGK